MLGEVSFEISYPALFGKGARGEEAVTASEKLKLSLKMTVRNENERKPLLLVDEGVSPPLSDTVQDSSLLPELLHVYVSTELAP